MSTAPGISHEVRRWMPAYAITLSSLSITLLAIRLFSRLKHIGGRAGFDDVLITIGGAFALALTVLVIISTTTLEINRHTYDVPPDLWVKGAFYGWWIEILFLLSTCATKLSVLLFYRRLVSATYSRRYKWALWVAMGFAVATSLVFVVILLTNCKPLRYTWDQFAAGYVDHHECVRPSKTAAFSIISGALSVSSDFYSVMLPSLLLMKLHISMRQRIGLVFIFGLGYLVVGAGAVRTYYISRVMGPELDKIWDCFSAYAAAVAEVNVAVVCASLPSLKSFSKHYLRSLPSKTSSDKPTDDEGNSERNVGFNKDRFNLDSSGTKLHPIAETPSLREEISFSDIHKYGLDSFTPVIHPPTHIATPKTPLNIVLRPATPATGLTAHPVNIQNASQLHTRPRSFSQPVHHGTSPDQSGSPSFVFLPDENDAAGLIRVRYRGYIDSSSEENMALSFPAMNPEIAQAQSMRDKREFESQERQRKSALSEAERASSPRTCRRSSQFRSGPSGSPARRIQVEAADHDRVSIDRNETSRIDSPTPSGSENGDDDEHDDEHDNKTFSINVRAIPVTATGLSNLPSPSPPMARPHTSPQPASEPRSPTSPARYHYLPRLVGLPSPTTLRRSRTVSGTGTAAQDTAARFPNATNAYGNGVARSSSLRTPASNAGDATAGWPAARGNGYASKSVEISRVKTVLTREKWRVRQL